MNISFSGGRRAVEESRIQMTWLMQVMREWTSCGVVGKHIAIMLLRSFIIFQVSTTKKNIAWEEVEE